MQIVRCVYRASRVTRFPVAGMRIPSQVALIQYNVGVLTAGFFKFSLSVITLARNICCLTRKDFKLLYKVVDFHVYLDPQRNFVLRYLRNLPRPGNGSVSVLPRRS